jgi:hypothetical protein
MVEPVNCSHVSIYCLPNIRAPWVIVYEPHPWGCGALRVKEESALLVFQRPVSRYEIEWLKDAICYQCITFKTLEKLIEFEDGQHENAAEVLAATELYRNEVSRILAKVKKKQDAKKAKERKRRISLPVVPRKK